jgi:hypothetical protein
LSRWSSLRETRARREKINRTARGQLVERFANRQQMVFSGWHGDLQVCHIHRIQTAPVDSAFLVGNSERTSSALSHSLAPPLRWESMRPGTAKTWRALSLAMRAVIRAPLVRLVIVNRHGINSR